MITPTSPSPDSIPSRGRRMLALVALPLALLAATVLFLVLVADRLPTEVAIHFGPHGQADGFADGADVLALFPLLQLLLWGTMAALGLFVGHQVGGTERAVAAMPAGIVAFLGGLAMTTVLPQLDLETARGLELSAWALPVSLGVGILAGLAAVLVHPPAPSAPRAQGPPPPGAPRAALQGATAVWRGQTPFPKGLMIFLGIVAAALGGLWWLTGAFIVTLGLWILLPITIAFLRFDLLVGPSKLVVRSLLGWPRMTLPLDTLTGAKVEQADPYEYGGWGWRLVPGRTAVITRGGPAVVVGRSDGAELLVSLDTQAEAEEAAGVINSLLDRRALADAETRIEETGDLTGAPAGS